MNMACKYDSLTYSMQLFSAIHMDEWNKMQIELGNSVEKETSFCVAHCIFAHDNNILPLLIV